MVLIIYTAVIRRCTTILCEFSHLKIDFSNAALSLIKEDENFKSFNKSYTSFEDGDVSFHFLNEKSLQIRFVSVGFSANEFTNEKEIISLVSSLVNNKNKNISLQNTKFKSGFMIEEEVGIHWEYLNKIRKNFLETYSEDEISTSYAFSLFEFLSKLKFLSDEFNDRFKQDRNFNLNGDKRSSNSNEIKESIVPSINTREEKKIKILLFFLISLLILFLILCVTYILYLVLRVD